MAKYPFDIFALTQKLFKKPFEDSLSILYKQDVIRVQATLQTNF